jgi:AAHS family 4-hydroxybenzoate transporter-like MFS transporter
VQPRRVDIDEIVETQDRSGFALSLFLLCCLVMLVDGFDNQAINYAAPLIIKDWQIGRELMTPVFSLSVFGWMVGSVGFSMLGDRVGRRNAILLAVLVFGVFTTAIPLARDLTGLAVLRFFAALGIGGAVPMAVALLSDYSPAKTRAFKITVLYLGYTVGSSGGGFLAAGLTPVYGWKVIFLVGGVTALLTGAVLAASLPESVRYLILRHARQDRVLFYANRLKRDAGFDGGTKFVMRETAQPGLPVRFLFANGRAAVTIFLWLALAFSFVTHFYVSAWLTTLLSEYSGRMTIPMAQRTAALFQMGAGFGIAMGWLVDKRGIPAVTWVMLLAALPVGAMGMFGSNAALGMALSALSGILVLGSAPGLNALAAVVYPAFMRCTGAGAAFAAARIGAIIGPVIAGALISLHARLDVIFIIGALPMLAAAAASYMLDKSMKAGIEGNAALCPD